MSFASMRTVAARGITCHKKHKFIGSTFDGHAVESFDKRNYLNALGTAEKNERIAFDR